MTSSSAGGPELEPSAEPTTVRAAAGAETTAPSPATAAEASAAAADGIVPPLEATASIAEGVGAEPVDAPPGSPAFAGSIVAMPIMVPRGVTALWAYQKAAIEARRPVMGSGTEAAAMWKAQMQAISVERAKSAAPVDIATATFWAAQMEAIEKHRVERRRERDERLAAEAAAREARGVRRRRTGPAAQRPRSPAAVPSDQPEPVAKRTRSGGVQAQGSMKSEADGKQAEGNSM